MTGKYCLIYNFSQHYREAIFKKMDLELNCEFYFGDKLDWAPDIKSMDLEKLKGFKSILKNRKIFKYFIWQDGAFKLVFKNYDYYILYGDAFYLSNWFIMIFARLLGKKTYLWTHGLYKDLKWKNKVINYPFYNLSTKVLLYGDYSRNKMIKLGFNKEKLLCIYNSLDYEKQIEVRNKLFPSKLYENYFKNSNPVIIYIGRIQKVKKINLILEAISNLKKEGIEVNLVLVGKDNESLNLMTIAENLKINDNIWMYGPSYDEGKIGELIYNADLCVSPGNIGLTAMHSLTYGTPAITHGNFLNQGPEFEAIKPNLTGDFFIEDSVSNLAKSIQKWINLDLIKRNLIRNNCYKVIDEFYNPNYQIKIFKSLADD
jgi:glycosyltransferase involved in cell wall biosynthesis